MVRPFFAIPEYHSYLSPSLAEHLLASARPIEGVPELVEIGDGGGLETKESLRFLADLYAKLEPALARVLARRTEDRKFIDERVAACHQFNRDLNRDWLAPDYQTVLSLEDAQGRIVIGPKGGPKSGAPVAPLPDFLKGAHVTLFGPPDSAKMAINAMNAYHRKLENEPPIVGELLSASPASPMWGADDEDSKTPLRADLMDAAVNLSACFDGTLTLTEGAKKYELAHDHLSLPIKRFPGLALPATFLFHKRNPIPLHLYDFALHLFANWSNQRALVFYVPKLENEEEAAYLHQMISTAESMIRKRHPEYRAGTVRLMIVLENPRAILRAHEIMDALHPYFAGASLGWHDYLASTARIFKNDSHYRIPVKADPGIVIKYIQASHLHLADAVGSRGGISVGGMYGILPLAGNPTSWQVALKGFIKDVVTQLKRNLTGFWVAHPDFVRLGLALVEAWQRRQAGDPTPLRTLVQSLITAEKDSSELLAFIDGPDTRGLDIDHPGYVRSLIVADIRESDYIANNHPEEIRYNVFQSLQYLTDWLSGNGCVALPTTVDGIPVRVMDDLATAERSRWEVWHELHHGRFAVEDFLEIVHQEMNFIRRDLSDEKKIVQVKWNDRTARWYPIAARLMLQLMTAREPVEFATELLLPFTLDAIRGADDPWSAALELDPEKYRLDEHVARYDHYFEICGARRFAEVMARNLADDLSLAENTIRSFTLDEILSAASFHGDIGQSKSTLDARAASEQAQVLQGEDAIREQLRELGARYREKFGFKFLISAQGKSGSELLTALRERIGNPVDVEMENARTALWEISKKRIAASARTDLKSNLEQLLKKHGVTGASIALSSRDHIQSLCFGESVRGRARVEPQTLFEIASLSKTVGSAFAIEYFRRKGIALDTSVNALFARTASPFRLRSEKDPAWADRVTLRELMNHSALNMHYVKGVPLDQPMPPVAELLEGRHGYTPVRVICDPGKSFQYSGGGFLVLEHLLESLEAHSIQGLTRPFLDELGLKNLTFEHRAQPCAYGYFDSGAEVPSTRYQFPAFAAGALGTATDVARFLQCLTHAFQNPHTPGPISHDTAVQMLHGRDLGSRPFMGCDMGLGVFTAEAGPNRVAIHQGANEGFRAIYLHCYNGPDQGKGAVIFCNGDNRAVLFIAEAMREILSALKIRGIDFSKIGQAFEFEKLPQEQIVNLGYKALIFDAFSPDLPEEIVQKGPLDPLASYNLATGARILSVTNQKFARAKNLLSPHLPVFDPTLFGRQGKIMDSWETARHNRRECDMLHLALKKPAPIRYVSLSTKYHDGNQAESVRLRALAGETWVDLLPKTSMKGHSLLQIDLEIDLNASGGPYSEIQVEIYPDGGLSRLGLFAELPPDAAAHFRTRDTAQCVRFSDPIPKTLKPLTLSYIPSAEETRKNLSRARGPIDFASAAFGGSLVHASNEHYGPAAQVISPYPPIHMFDGLESARSRAPGHSEEVVLQLGRPSAIEKIVIDFTFFVNNNPLWISIEGLQGETWTKIAPKTEVKAFAGNQKEFTNPHSGPFSQVRIRTYPDGGINRIKVFGESKSLAP
jgi:malate synthase